jgi:uncharacterized metal-binding protein YceD (DUF177 family)
MKIPFTKVSKDAKYPLEFKNGNDQILSNFKFKPKTGGNLVHCELKFKGQLDTHCSICGKNIISNIDEKIELLINNGIFNGFDEEFDVYEMLNGNIDLDEILISEIELIKSDYYKCNDCNNLTDHDNENNYKN